jgi:tetratricopeptide (TPR) repeat protein
MPEATAESPLAEMQNEQFATCHRERGNGLYKGGKLLEGNHLQLHLRLKEDYLTLLLAAIDAYRDACATAPEDPRPLSNLSATHFEVGDYRESIKTAQHALTLLHSQSDPLKSRLQTRLAKAYVLRRRYKEAAEVLDSSEHQDRAMTEAVEHANSTLEHVGDTSNYRMKIIDSLPRYLPMM